MYGNPGEARLPAVDAHDCINKKF